MIRITALFVSLLMCSGCATIVSSGTQEITILSDPPDATVMINDIDKGKTPLRTLVERDGTYHVRVIKDGYDPHSALLTRSINGWVFGNILLGGLIGAGIDFVTGAAYAIDPDTINVTLQSNDTGSDQASNSDTETASAETQVKP